MPPSRRSLAPAESSSSAPLDRPSARARKPPTAFASSEPLRPPAPVSIPTSYTPEYDAGARAAGNRRRAGQASGRGSGSGSSSAKGKGKAKDELVVVYNDDEKDQLLYEVLGVVPRRLLEEVVELCRVSVNEATEKLERYLNAFVGRAGGGDARIAQEQREVDQGIVSIESLMVAHSDEALDKFVSWALRNTFRVPDGQQYTLPWQSSLDYARGTYIQTMGGNEAVHAKLEALRNQVEDVRKVEHKLTLANAKLDQKLRLAEQRQAEIAFVREQQQDYPHLAGVPLSTAAKQIKAALLALHTKLEDMDLPAPPAHGDVVRALAPGSTGEDAHADADGGAAPDGAKPWEKGRAAYLAWGVGRVVAAAGSGGGMGGEGVGGRSDAARIGEDEEKRLVDTLGRETERVGDVDGMARMGAGLP